MALPWPLWYLEACRFLSYPTAHHGNAGRNSSGPTNSNSNADHQQQMAALEMMQKMAYHHQQQQNQQNVKHQQQQRKETEEEDVASIKSGVDDEDDDDDRKRDVTIPIGDDDDDGDGDDVFRNKTPSLNGNSGGDDGDETDKCLDSPTEGVDEVDDDDMHDGANRSFTLNVNEAPSLHTKTTSNNSNIINISNTHNNSNNNNNDATTTETTGSVHLLSSITCSLSTRLDDGKTPQIAHHETPTSINNNNGGSKRRKQPRKSINASQRDLADHLVSRDHIVGNAGCYRSDDDDDDYEFGGSLEKIKREFKNDPESGRSGVINSDQSDWRELQNGVAKIIDAQEIASGCPKIQSRRQLGLLAQHGIVPPASRCVGGSNGGGRQQESNPQQYVAEDTSIHNVNVDTPDDDQRSSASTKSDDAEEDGIEDENKALFGLLRNPAFNPWTFPENLAQNGRDSTKHGSPPVASGLSLMDRRFMPSPPLSPGPQLEDPHQQQHHHHHHGQQQWTYEEQFKQLYELSDDPKRKEFLDDLFSFMQKRGTPVNRIPIMAKQTLDLYELFQLVVSKGGLVEVINKKLWREITKGLNLPSSITSAAFTLRTQYMKYLYPYESERLKLSTLSELQYAVDGNRREGRRPGTFGDDPPRGSTMGNMMNHLQNPSMPGLLSVPHLNSNTIVSGFQDNLAALAVRASVNHAGNVSKDKESSPNSSPYQHRSTSQKPMSVHHSNHPLPINQSHLFFNPSNHHHQNLPLRTFNDGESVSMATRAMAEMTKRMEDASRLAAAASNQRFADHLQAIPAISPYCLPFRHPKRENAENFSPSPPKQMLLDGGRQNFQNDQSRTTPACSLNGINIKLTNNGDGVVVKDDSLTASMEINGITYRGVLYPQKKQQQQQHGADHANNCNINNINNPQQQTTRAKSPEIEVNETSG